MNFNSYIILICCTFLSSVLLSMDDKFKPTLKLFESEVLSIKKAKKWPPKYIAKLKNDWIITAEKNIFGTISTTLDGRNSRQHLPKNNKQEPILFTILESKYPDFKGKKP